MMNSKRFRYVLMAVFAFLVIGFFLIGTRGLSILHKKSLSMVDLKLKNKTAEAELDNLQASKKDIQKYSYFKSVAATVIPNDKDQAQAVLEINQFAQQAHIRISSITFPVSTLGGSTTNTTTQSAPTLSLNPSAPAVSTLDKTKILSQAVPVSGVKGLYSLTLHVKPLIDKDLPADQQSTYPKMLDFLSRIENNRRTAQIAQVQIEPDRTSGQLSFDFQINIFLKP